MHLYHILDQQLLLLDQMVATFDDLTGPIAKGTIPFGVGRRGLPTRVYFAIGVAWNYSLFLSLSVVRTWK